MNGPLLVTSQQNSQATKLPPRPVSVKVGGAAFLKAVLFPNLPGAGARPLPDMIVRSAAGARTSEGCLLRKPRGFVAGGPVPIALLEAVSRMPHGRGPRWLNSGAAAGCGDGLRRLPSENAGYARNRRRRGQRCGHGMAISPMASRAMALSYSRLDRLVRIDTAGGRTIRIVWIVNTLLALSTMRSQAANFFS
jgi:hypothetical protein